MIKNEFQIAVNGFINDLDCNHCSESTIKAYRSDLVLLNEFLDTRYKNLLNNLSAMKTSHVLQYRDFLFHQKGFKRKTADRKFFCFRKFCEYLELAGFIEKNPALEVKHKKYKDTKAPNYLEWEEIYQIIDVVALFETENTARDVAMLSVLAYLGCRRSEVLDLDWKDVDFQKKEIAIYRRKTKTYDYLPMHPNLENAMRRYYAENRFNPKGPLFLSELGNRLSVTAFKQMFDRAVLYSGIEKQFTITPHTFRHSFISNMIREGASIAEIQEYTGHSDLGSLQVYFHMDTQHKRNILSKIPA